MIQISESAQAHFRKLIAREDLPGLGVRLAARQRGELADAAEDLLGSHAA